MALTLSPCTLFYNVDVVYVCLQWCCGLTVVVDVCFGYVCTTIQIYQLMHSVYQKMCKNLILVFFTQFFPIQIGRRVEIFEEGVTTSLIFFFTLLDYIVNLSFGCISFLFMVASVFEFDFPKLTLFILVLKETQLSYC